jgi:AhpD family alkylhydroperoxidase
MTTQPSAAHVVDAEPRPASFPDAYKRMNALQAVVDRVDLDRRYVHLVKLRASQINGCAFCIDLHVEEALANGVPERLLHLLPAWREVDAFDARDQAALALAEAVTLVHEDHVPRDVWDAAAAVFSEAELMAVLWQAIAINAWNRLMIATRMPPASLASVGPDRAAAVA